MPSTKSIRFVGGPWHNRIELVELIPRIIVQGPISVPSGQQRRDYYSLAEYQTGGGSVYWQYVHTSLISPNGKYAATCTCRERFKKWRVSRRELEQRLSQAMKPRRKRGCSNIVR